MVGESPRALYQRFLPDLRHGPRAFVWKYAQAVGGRRPRHFHAEPELNLVIRGSATFGVGTRVTTVSAGELLVFAPGQDHALLSASPDLFLYAIGLDSAYSSEVLGPPYATIVPGHFRLEAAELAIVTNRAADIVDRADAEQLGAELWSRVNSLGDSAARRAPIEASPHVLTRRALQGLASAPELGLEGLAAGIGAHPSDVSRYFHRDLGIKLVSYRTRVRLLHMIGLVDSGRHDLMEAASMAGFGSYAQCHRSFRAELGCAPREFFAPALRERMQLTYEPR